MQDPAPSLSEEDADLIERYFTGGEEHRLPPANKANVALVDDLVRRGVLERRLSRFGVCSGFVTFRLTSDGYLALKAFRGG
ncbi:MAG: hypothetical protein AAFY19_10250 [Pseudomonadota bacterium]